MNAFATEGKNHQSVIVVTLGMLQAVKTDEDAWAAFMNKKQGGNFAALSPTDFIAAVTQHIPDKGFQLVRYYGWYSKKARGVRAKTGAAQAEDSAQGHEPDRAPTSAQ